MTAHENDTTASRFIKYWVPVIIYATFIFYLSSIPGQYTPKLFAHQDVILHIIEYAIFAFLVNRAFKEYYPHLSFMGRFFWVFFLSVLYAMSDEFHQAFVPNRSSSVFDVAIDGIGVFLANIFYPVRKMLFSKARLCNGVYTDDKDSTL